MWYSWIFLVKEKVKSLKTNSFVRSFPDKKKLTIWPYTTGSPKRRFFSSVLSEASASAMILRLYSSSPPSTKASSSDLRWTLGKKTTDNQNKTDLLSAVCERASVCVRVSGNDFYILLANVSDGTVKSAACFVLALWLDLEHAVLLKKGER